MKHELTKHLIPLLIVLLLTSLFWLLSRTPWYEFLILVAGLAFGAFFLDIDHLIYWLYTHPELEESRVARLTLTKYDYHSTLTLLESVRKKHTDLIFHHIIFQIILICLSIFAFTSTDSIFGKSFLLALNVHLFVDELEDFQTDPAHLQAWLFARLKKQLPISFLKKYLLIVFLSLVFFCLLLVKSKA